MADVRNRLELAVKHFWRTRQKQSSTQKKAGTRDTGARSAVTGGRQMDGFVELVRDLLVDAGCPADAIHLSSKLELPGWFRAEKKWDLVVVHEKRLIAAVEFKSQVGPSFGNNFNNRSEEALGSALDLTAAYREGAFKPSPKPWLGYLMLLEDCDASSRAVSVSEPHFPVFPEFKSASYRERYSVLVRKLVRDRLYDRACFLLSKATDGAKGKYSEPDEELGFDLFIRPLVAHVTGMIG